ncbi:MAG: hypothetical protein FIA95_01660 [Gemmatimonadetes bacterium]|nr:hypothetical protein [Gemmatimonadota bacterium]
MPDPISKPDEKPTEKKDDQIAEEELDEVSGGLISPTELPTRTTLGTLGRLPLSGGLGGVLTNA